MVNPMASILLIFYMISVAENSIYPSTQSRSMSQGEGLIGMDVVFDFGSTLSLIYIPEFDNPSFECQGKY